MVPGVTHGLFSCFMCIFDLILMRYFRVVRIILAGFGVMAMMMTTFTQRTETWFPL